MNKIVLISLSVILIATISLSFISSSNYLKINPINDALAKIIVQFKVFNKKNVEERVYLHLDKTLYKPGETILFSAYLRNAKDFTKSDQSNIVNVELISPKGTIISTIKIIANNGISKGDFALTEDIAGGIYKIKAYTNWQKNFEKELIFEKEIQVQKFVLPRLKMKLDFIRDAYGSGDKVTAELNLNTNTNTALANYYASYVVKIDGKDFTDGGLETNEEGIAFVKFTLPENLESNDGLLNIMIDYEGQTESISRSIPIVLNNISLNFYPEGGDMVNNLNTNIAFRALDEFGKPADIEGIIIDNSGRQITDFKSFHDGMGGFNFTPENGKKYHAKITKPTGIEEKYNLPKMQKTGFVMNIDNSENRKLNLKINSTIDDEISIVAQVRGEIYHSESFEAKKGENTISISTKNFPIGVSQVTLFDSKGVPRAERLVFVNKDKELNIKIETNKEKYQPREKVKMTISIEDENGKPVAGNLSVAVVDDQLLSFADDKSGNILSKLLLETDVDLEVDEPTFYFDKEEEDADQALDYLLMTAGWRRYTWEEVLKNKKPQITYQPEQTVIVAGTVIDASTLQNIANAKIQVGETEQVYYSDKNGKFEIRVINLYFNLLKISAKDYNSADYKIYNNKNLTIYLCDNNNNEIMVTGTVVDENGESIPSVTITKNNGNTGTISDFDGNYRIKVNSCDTLTFSAMGLKEYRTAVNSAKIDVTLELDDQEIQVVVVTGLGIKRDKKELGYSVTTVDNGNKKKRNDRSALNSLQGKVAGVSIKNSNKQKNNKKNTNPKITKEYANISDNEEEIQVRTDFRSTIYWNGNVEFDKKGTATLEFYNSDAISSFRITTEGISNSGTIGRAEQVFFTQLPFAMATKLPVEVLTGDIMSIPLTLKNNTQKDITGKLNIEYPEGFELLSQINYNQIIKAEEVRTIYLQYKINNNASDGNFIISFKAKGLQDAFIQEIKVVSKGFPVLASFSGQEISASYNVNLQDVVEGSITAQLIAYPSVVSDLMEGVASILREPHGCFEQTSMSSYPNLMVMDYLQTTESEDDKLLARAENLLDKGYNRLTTYETPKKGYEWFGGAPGHESLTAYGLMQFNDMVGVYDGVNQEMINRTADWLMSRKDGKGGFSRNSRALDSYGGANDEITNAYIVWALSEAGYTDIKLEVETSYKQAVKSNDPYILALMSNTMFNLGEEKKAEELLNTLYKIQTKNGNWTGSSHSITRSTGNSLTIETTSIVMLAMMKSNKPKNEVINKSVEYLVGSRNGYGTFGNTQGTILALKALTAYAKHSKKTDEGGTIEIYVDKVKVAEKSYQKGENEAIVIEGLEKHITSGKNKITVKYLGVKNPLPYSIAVQWNTTLPNSSKECVVDLECKLASNKAKVGETVRLTSTITNKTTEGQPMTVAIIGIPAGLTAQPWQLKELQEKQIVDYYETSGNSVILYYRYLAPSEIKTVNLDLKAELPGTYEAPASSAYLYYTNEFKVWKSLDKIEISK